MFAGNSGLQRVERQPLSIHHCARRVAAEAGGRFVGGKPSPQRLLQSSRSNIGITDRDSESADRRIVADEDLIVDAVALKRPGLRPIAKAPVDGKRYGSSSVGYGICALTILGLHDVAVAVFLKRKLGMGVQYGIRSRRLQRASHGTTWLCLCLRAMTTRAACGRTLLLFLPGQGTACYEQKN